MGVVIKKSWKQAQQIDKEIYHVSVMPCYDKKLEASRLDESGGKDVDSVLTPVEIEMLLSSRAVVFNSLGLRKLDVIHKTLESNQVLSHLGSGSGGYTENVFRFALKQLMDRHLSNSEQLEYKTRRNRDFLEVEVVNGNTKLLFAVVNGFRNIQTLVQRMKRKTCDYQYVEVMACPSGCLNGGAQLRGDTVEEKLYDKVEDLYKSLDVTPLPLDLNDENIKNVYENWFPNDEAIDANLYTTFKPVPKTVNLLTMHW
ncbi:Cytosolic Fe-S cluster assembly factor narfl [Halotydeus destructor]|nr:Cytosolic Fe-S cluster assembly factor narfl [Halotydeus destructor]